MDFISDKDFTMDDINTELNNILTAQKLKYPSKIMYSSETLKSTMKVLSESLDALNLPTFDWNCDTEDQKAVLYEVVNSSLELLNLYKNTRQKLTNADCQKNCYKKNIDQLNGEITELKKEVDSKSKKIHVLKNEISKMTSHLDDEKKTVNATKTEKNLLQKRLSHKENQLQHSINEKKALSEAHTKKLQGTFKSLDRITAAKLLEYEKNENMHRKVISKLDQNNKDLVNELVDLREQFLHNNLMNDKE